MATPAAPSCPPTYQLGTYTKAVDSIINDLWSFASDRLGDMDGATSSLDQFVGGWALPAIPQYTPVSVDLLALPPIPPDVETVNAYIDASDIYYPKDVNIHTPKIGSAPTFTAKAPTFDLTGQPGAAPTFGKEAPDLQYHELPTSPVVSLPGVPVFHSIKDIVAAELNIPTFAATFPEFIGVYQPPGTIEFQEDEYSSNVLTAVRTQLYDVLSGIRRIAIPEAVWTEIENAAASKISDDADRLIETASAEHFRRGWEQPGGALNKTIALARFEGQKARGNVTRELLVERAKQEIENMKYYTAQALVFEQMMIGLFNAQMDRRLKAAEIVASLAFKLMDAQIAIYNAKLAAFQAAAQTHEVLVRAELLKLEQLKADIEIEGLKTEQDKAKVQLYVAQIDAATKVVQIYESQIRAVATKVEVDKTRISAFGEEVRVFQARTDAWKGEWDGYRAKIQGELGKADVYKSQADAYTARVQAYGQTVQAEVAKVEADGRRASIEISKLEADTRRFAAEIDAKARQLSADVELAKLPYEAYKAQGEWWRAMSSTYEAQLKVDVEQAKATAQIAMEGARLEVAQIQAQRELGFKALEGQQRISAQLTASALQGIHAQASIGSNISFQDSTSKSCGVNWQYTANTTE